MALFAGTHSFSPERGVVPFPRHRFHQPTLICHQLNRSVDPHRSYIGRVGLDVMKWPAAARRGVRQHPSLANRFPQGQRGWLSPAHDVSGRGSARSARQLWPFWEGLDAPDGRPFRGAHGSVFEHSQPLAIGGAEPGRGGGALGVRELTSPRWTALGSFRQNVRRGICGRALTRSHSIRLQSAARAKMFARPCLLREQQEREDR